MVHEKISWAKKIIQCLVALVLCFIKVTLLPLHCIVHAYATLAAQQHNARYKYQRRIQISPDTNINAGCKYLYRYCITHSHALHYTLTRITQHNHTLHYTRTHTALHTHTHRYHRASASPPEGGGGEDEEGSCKNEWNERVSDLQFL